MDKKIVEQMADLLSPTEEQRERMLHNIFTEGKGCGNATRPRMRGFRPALAVAVLCCLLTTTAFAAVLGMDGKLLDFLKPGDGQQAEYLASGVYNVDKKIVEPNGSLEIKQVVGDDNLTYILMDFTAQEGTALNAGRYIFENSDFSAGEGGYSVDLIQIEDDDPEDNKISMILSIISDHPIQGAMAELKFTNLMAGPARELAYLEEFKTVASGTWEAKIPMKYENYSSAYAIGKPVSLYGFDATVETVSVSPISIALKIGSPSLREINQAIRENGGLQELEEDPSKYLDPLPVKICYEDGTSEVTRIFNGMAHSRYVQKDAIVNEMLLVKTFDQVINDKKIESIEFFGLQIPLEKSGK